MIVSNGRVIHVEAVPRATWFANHNNVEVETSLYSADKKPHSRSSIAYCCLRCSMFVLRSRKHRAQKNPRIPEHAYGRRDNFTYLDLAYFRGHRRYILPPLSPSQPVFFLFADGEMIFSGSIPGLFFFFVFLALLLFCFFVLFSSLLLRTP